MRTAVSRAKSAQFLKFDLSTERTNNDAQRLHSGVTGAVVRWISGQFKT